MAVYLELVNHDRLFAESSSQPIIVNDFDLSSQDDLEKLNKLIYTTYSSDSLEVLPTCDCGEMKGEYNVGLVCKDCGSQCLSVTERPLESALWLAPPTGVDTLINPEVWLILKKHLTVSGVSILDYLTNPLYRVPTEKVPDSLTKLRRREVPRGLNYFYHHFDEIMDILINGKVVTTGKLKKRKELLEFLQKNREAIFSQHVPVPSKLAFITEKMSLGSYADPSMTPAVDAIRTITSVENSVTPLSSKMKQARTVQAISSLAEYYYQFFKDSMSPKEGWFRKHIYGSRVHFSFRAVITSLSRPHIYDETHLPWSMSVMFLKIHLISKLLKRGFTPNEAVRHLHEHTLSYSSLLDEIFQELIAESPHGGLPIILQRNPSLTRGSAQNLRVTKVKTDPNDNTIGLSVLVLSALNADFDGDQLNGLLIHDVKTQQRMERLKPHLYAVDLSQPRTLSRFMALPMPTVAQIAAWVHDD